MIVMRWRKRPPEKWSYETSTTNFGRTGMLDDEVERQRSSAIAEKAMSRARVSANLCDGGQLYRNGPILIFGWSGTHAFRQFNH